MGSTEGRRAEGSRAERNRELGLAINRDIWNGRRFELVPDYYTDDFVADYSPRVVRHGRAGVIEAVEAAHATFRNFRETVHRVIADDQHVVLHFTISGVQVAPWGPIPASGKAVSYPEIVIMRITDGKVSQQWGVSDALLALQQLGVMADPAGHGRAQG